jgi:alpha-N-arabinofuranosidase
MLDRDETMSAIDRRGFLDSLGRAGAMLAAGSLLDAIGYAQVARGPARAFIRPDGRADFDRRVLGAFLEHLGRAIYTGVYEPGSKRAGSTNWRHA